MSVKDGRQKSTAKVSNACKKTTKLSSPVGLASQNKQLRTAVRDFPSADGEKGSLRSLERGLKPSLAKVSTASHSKLASKSDCRSSVRSSTGSCHDACKFGTHHGFADSNAAKSGGRSPVKRVAKVGAAKISRIITPAAAGPTSKPATSTRIGTANVSKIAVRKSPVPSRQLDASVTKSGGAKPNSINCRAQPDPRSVKSNGTSAATPDSKFKVARSLFRSPRSVASNKILGSKISINDFSDSVKCQPPRAARSLFQAFQSPGHDLLSQSFGPEFNYPIMDDKAEEEFFSQYSAGELECTGRYCVKSHDEISFEAFSGDQSSEYSEISPRSLEAYVQEAYEQVRKGIYPNAKGYDVAKMRFRRGRGVVSAGDSNPEPESVVLRHQDMQGRKPSEEYLINRAIEEAVNKLSHVEESKVKVLVGAFETVMSVKDSQVDLKNDEGKEGGLSDHTRRLQACN